MRTARYQNNSICMRTYMPLVLAFARTIHSFQGASVGKTGPGQPDNTFHRIIADPGERKYEANMTGLFYTLLSRATTLGEEGKPETSAILFNGRNMNPARIRNITKTEKGEMYKKVQDLRDWVEYLEKHTINKVGDDKIQDILKWVKNMVKKPIKSNELAKWVGDYTR